MKMFHVSNLAKCTRAKIENLLSNVSYYKYYIIIFLLFLTLFGPFLWLLKSDNKLSDAIQLLISIILIFTIITTIVNHTKEINFKKSKEYLDRSIEYFNKSLEILTNKTGTITSDRVSWVTAARILKRADYLSSLITIDAHKKIYEVELDFTRHNLSKLLNMNNGGNLYTFYIGGSFNDYVHGLTNILDKNTGGNMIPVPVLTTILKFSFFPANYTDSLDKNEYLDRDQLLYLHSNRKNFFKYLIFRKYFYIVGTDVLKKDGADYTPVQPLEINNLLDSLVEEEAVELMAQ